jgi:hypothetical protein
VGAGTHTSHACTLRRTGTAVQSVIVIAQREARGGRMGRLGACRRTRNGRGQCWGRGGLWLCAVVAVVVVV